MRQDNRGTELLEKSGIFWAEEDVHPKFAPFSTAPSIEGRAGLNRQAEPGVFSLNGMVN